MNKSIYPCLWFDDNAKEALAFYCGVFGDGKITEESPLAVRAELHGQKFMGLNGGPLFKINPAVSFFVNCASAEEIETTWAALTDGGMVLMPLDHYPWSKEKYGFCQDKFGVCWQVMLAAIGGQKFVPALMFTQEQAGKAEEAMSFYGSIFDNSEVVSVSRYQPGEPDAEGTIKHAQFTLNGQFFVALDSSGPHQFKFNEGVSFVVDCDTQDEIDYFWGKLTADGGQESRCGWLKDKFGVSWQIVPALLGALMSDPERGPKVVAAFMQMKKFDLETLLKA